MRQLITRFAVLCTVALLVLTPAFAHRTQAQDTMTHVCDSTLITLLYIAENDYGYHSMMDTATFDKGQYAPLFDAMMAAMDDSEMMAPTEEAMMEAPTEAMMMEGDMTTLTAGVVADEDPACTALRTDVEAFLYKHFSDAMAM